MSELDDLRKRIKDLKKSRDELDAQIKEVEASADALEAVANEKALNAIGLSQHNWYSLKLEYDDWYKSFLGNGWVAHSAREGHPIRVLSVQDNGLIRYKIPLGHISIEGVTPAEMLIPVDD